MQKTIKDASTVKHNNHTSTSIGTTSGSMATEWLPCSNPYSIPCFEDFIAEAQRRFNVEKNAKDKANAFILSMGLLDEFAQFSKDFHSDDMNKLCRDLLDGACVNGKQPDAFAK
ncbi:hypothetical protein EZS27_016134 [termite gut metagenome]|uniref:Uncharacterized protein n=1 Tax=termite gut metagenome TaxID=433724 RepID=A0A5J4RRR4_9ZZZZ